MGRQSNLQLPNRKRRQQSDQQSCSRRRRQSYGTTSEGGLGSGTIFKLAPIGGGQWIESVVHLFEGPPDGGFSYNGMVVDRFGNFYGATVHGGTDDDGCVYKLTP
jgi:hypothetical protein